MAHCFKRLLDASHVGHAVINDHKFCSPGEPATSVAWVLTEYPIVADHPAAYAAGSPEPNELLRGFGEFFQFEHSFVVLDVVHQFDDAFASDEPVLHAGFGTSDVELGSFHGNGFQIA